MATSVQFEIDADVQATLDCARSALLEDDESPFETVSADSGGPQELLTAHAGRNADRSVAKAMRIGVPALESHGYPDYQMDEEEYDGDSEPYMRRTSASRRSIVGIRRSCTRSSFRGDSNRDPSNHEAPLPHAHSGHEPASCGSVCTVRSTSTRSASGGYSDRNPSKHDAPLTHASLGQIRSTSTRAASGGYSDRDPSKHDAPLPRAPLDHEAPSCGSVCKLRSTFTRAASGGHSACEPINHDAPLPRAPLVHEAGSGGSVCEIRSTSTQAASGGYSDRDPSKHDAPLTPAPFGPESVSCGSVCKIRSTVTRAASGGYSDRDPSKHDAPLTHAPFGSESVSCGSVCKIRSTVTRAASGSCSIREWPCHGVSSSDPSRDHLAACCVWGDCSPSHSKEASSHSHLTRAPSICTGSSFDAPRACSPHLESAHSRFHGRGILPESVRQGRVHREILHGATKRRATVGASASRDTRSIASTMPMSGAQIRSAAPAAGASRETTTNTGTAPVSNASRDGRTVASTAQFSEIGPPRSAHVVAPACPRPTAGFRHRHRNIG